MGRSLFPSLYYLELTAALRRGNDGPLWCQCECHVHQFADGAAPYALGFGACMSVARSRGRPGTADDGSRGFQLVDDEGDALRVYSDGKVFVATSGVCEGFTVQAAESGCGAGSAGIATSLNPH